MLEVVERDGIVDYNYCGIMGWCLRGLDVGLCFLMWGLEVCVSFVGFCVLEGERVGDCKFLLGESCGWVLVGCIYGVGVGVTGGLVGGFRGFCDWVFGCFISSVVLVGGCRFRDALKVLFWS